MTDEKKPPGPLEPTLVQQPAPRKRELRPSERITLGQSPTLPSTEILGDSIYGGTLAKKYELGRLLGVGGMGRVYSGKHLTLGVPIAVKVMHPDVAMNEENLARFEREARAASLLQHRNVVRILDFGVDQGLRFIVMELLAGQSLGDWLAEHPTPRLDDVGRILDELLTALEAAHSLGIVHRDLKPDNVFLAREPGGAEIVKILDFGLAHLDDRPAGQTLTQADAVAGTPLYMSPEQCRSLAVGAPTDLYAVGCILTEMLQNAPLFTGAQSMDVMVKQMFQPLPELARPANAEPVPPLLERLRADLLAKIPEQRPTAARARELLRDALDPAVNAEQLPGRQSGAGMSRASRAPRWPDRDAREPAPPSSMVSLGVAPGASFDVSAANFGHAGIRVVTPPSGALDVIVVDAAPVDRAIAELASARAQHGEAPVVVMTEAPGSEGIARLIAAGAADVVLRGAPIERLVTRVLKVARRARRPSP
ncbi:MAG: protein kinase [Polyangiaceae bacterium]